MPLLFNANRFAAVKSVTPLEMERLGYGYGYVLYTTTINALTTPTVLTIPHVQDRALIYVDQVFQGELGLAVPDQPTALILQPPAFAAPTRATSTLAIVVENKGRPSGEVQDFEYARKGIFGIVSLGSNNNLTNWTNYKLPMTWEDLRGRLAWQSFVQGIGQKPAFYRGTLTIPDQQPLHTWLLTNGWGRGFVLINGFNLGR